MTANPTVTRRNFLLGAALCATMLSGCNQGGGGQAAAEDQPAAAPAAGGNVLVAYYSAQGHTAVVAQAIADELGADLFKVTPTEPYSDDDLDWTDDSSRVTREHETRACATSSLRRSRRTAGRTTTPCSWGIPSGGASRPGPSTTSSQATTGTARRCSRSAPLPPRVLAGAASYSPRPRAAGSGRRASASRPVWTSPGFVIGSPVSAWHKQLEMADR